MATTKPLPPTAQDPAIIEGQQIKAGFVPAAQAIRMNRSLDELESAQQVVDLWNRTNERLAELFNDLTARRQARLADLESTVPLGPPITAKMSDADKALMQQAFRAALAEARSAPAEERGREPGSIPLVQDRSAKRTLAGMLADAERFDDDIFRRAVLTAAFEDGDMRVVRSYTDMHGLTGQLQEYYDLQNALAGVGTDGSWNYVAFALIRPPHEVAELPRLIEARQAARDAAIRLNGGR